MDDTIRWNNKHKFKRYSVYSFIKVWANRIRVARNGGGI